MITAEDAARRKPGLAKVRRQLFESGLVYAVVGGFTSSNTSFLVTNSDFHFVLAMDVIVCTTGDDLRTSVCMSPTILEADVLWS